MVNAIPASIRKSNCSWKIRTSSWSKPTIMPATTIRLWDWIVRMLSMSGRWTFCRFFVSTRLSRRGDSTPTKTLVKFASRRSSSSWGFSATVTVISAEKVMGQPVARPKSTSARKSCSAYFVFPMKLASEKLT